MWLLKRIITALTYFSSSLILSISMSLLGCSDSKLHEKPHQYFYQVGLLGHGRGAIGDLRLNSFNFERRCDSCHGSETKKHQTLGRCNDCHQPHILGWEKSLFPRNHQDLPLAHRPYHGQLDCLECHQSVINPEEFNKTSCQHCHNHQAQDIEYAHDLMDDYNLEHFTQEGACISCHSLSGTHYPQYFDQNSGESL